EKLVTAISRRLTGAPAKNTSVLGVRSRATNGIPHSHTATGTKGNNGLKPTAFPVSPSTSTDRALAKPNSISQRLLTLGRNKRNPREGSRGVWGWRCRFCLQAELHHVHAAAHAGIVVLLFFRLVGNDRFRGQEHSRHRGRVLQGGASHLRRIDDTRLDHIDPLAGQGVEADARSEERRVGKEGRSRSAEDDD